MVGAIVHEWLESHGGAEKVLEQFSRIYPEAPVVALWNDAPHRFPRGLVEETWLARTPLRQHKGLALPLMPLTWRTLGAMDADWILCASHLFAHHAKFSGPAKVAKKYVYAYTPARYIWNPEMDERGKSWPIRAASIPLKKLDRHRAQEAHQIASISKFVQSRVENSWHRESTVIYPPVDVSAFIEEPTGLTESELELLEGLPQVFVLGASRFIPYKRLDLVIDLGVAADVPVVLAGSGPDEARLRSHAQFSRAGVTFVARPSQALLSALYRRSLAYVFPPIEDFGIMPVEAMAAGTPVIGSRLGGTAETVIHGQTGILLDDWGSDSMRAAVAEVESLRSEDAQLRAWHFDTALFEDRVRAWLPPSQ